jgi:hypothetical protein
MRGRDQPQEQNSTKQLSSTQRMKMEAAKQFIARYETAPPREALVIGAPGYAMEAA